MTATAPTTAPSRQAGRFIQSREADLEELVVEIQSRIDEQIAEHGEMHRLVADDRGREAVEDRTFARAVENLEFQIANGTRQQQIAAAYRVKGIHDRGEAAEDRLITALVSLLGVHNVDAHQLRRLVNANRGAIAGGAAVELDEPKIPAHLLERQRNGKAARA